MAMTGEVRGRGRPPFRWPLATGACRAFHHGRHLSRALIQHAKACPQCEAFHARRFGAIRWRAAWAKQPTYQGRPCDRCGSTGRRPHDGECYRCATGRRPLDAANLKPGLRADGRSRMGRAEWLRRQAATADRDRVDARHAEHGDGWRAEGERYGDGRIHVRVLNLGRWPRRKPGEAVFNDPQFHRHPTRGHIIRLYDGPSDGPLSALLHTLTKDETT
ncbi:hypothetical protein OKW37_002643 [Paraburkholderia sp. MM5482-R2]